MTMKRVVLEIGMGTDIRGADYTKAAVRALRDALWHNSFSAEAATLPAEETARIASAAGHTATTAPDVATALREIAAADPAARVLICGSLYLAGTVLRDNG